MSKQDRIRAIYERLEREQAEAEATGLAGARELARTKTQAALDLDRARRRTYQQNFSHSVAH